MLICKNCNKEYTQSLKFCPSCGSELIENPVENPANEKKCKNCGSTIVGDEKFCIKCGTPTNDMPAQEVKEESVVSKVQYPYEHQERLQDELKYALRSNKFFEFFWKYAIVFALYYPIYLLMARSEGLRGLVEILDYISIFGFYAYYIGLAALWSKKNYLPMLIAFAIRFLNSFILLFQSEVPISSICRIAVLVTAFVFVFKVFKRTAQYQRIRSSFDTSPCPVCGASVKANDKFCPKCGRKMEG